jgi:hypothetical protein
MKHSGLWLIFLFLFPLEKEGGLPFFSICCQIAPKCPGAILLSSSIYLISRSDSYEACKSQTWEVTQGQLSPHSCSTLCGGRTPDGKDGNIKGSKTLLPFL